MEVRVAGVVRMMVGDWRINPLIAPKEPIIIIVTDPFCFFWFVHNPCPEPIPGFRAGVPEIGPGSTGPFSVRSQALVLGSPGPVWVILSGVQCSGPGPPGFDLDFYTPKLRPRHVFVATARIFQRHSAFSKKV